MPRPPIDRLPVPEDAVDAEAMRRHALQVALPAWRRAVLGNGATLLDSQEEKPRADR